MEHQLTGNQKVSRSCTISVTTFVKIPQLCWDNEHFQKKSKSGKHFTFFHFLRWIFYGFSKMLVFWKEEMPLVNSNPASIYEIFLQVRVLCRSLSGSGMCLDPETKLRNLLTFCDSNIPKQVIFQYGWDKFRARGKSQQLASY